MIAGLLGGAGLRLYAYGAAALAVALILFGAYRRGVQAERAADNARVLSQVRRNLTTREAVRDEIRQTSHDGGPSAVDRLRASKWTRDDGPERV